MFAEAEILYCKGSLASTRRFYGDEDLHVTESLDTLAYVLYQQGRYSEAETLYRKALAIRVKILGEDHPHTARSYSHLASVLWKLDKYATSETMARRSLAMPLRVFREIPKKPGGVTIDWPVPSTPQGR